MLTVKDNDFIWNEDITVQVLLDQIRKKEKYRDILAIVGTVILINGKIVTTDRYEVVTVAKNDVINLLSIAIGG